MTRGQETLLLRRFKREDTVEPSRRLYFSATDYEFTYNSYMRSLIDILIKKLRTSDVSLIDMVENLYYEMDDYASDPEDSFSPIIHAYACIMQSCMVELMRYLKEALQDAEN